MHDRIALRSSAVVGLMAFIATAPVCAAEFDCKANWKVDFVICRSPEGMRAIGALQEVWNWLSATVSPEYKAALVREEFTWMKAYPAECGNRRRRQAAAGSDRPDRGLRGRSHRAPDCGPARHGAGRRLSGAAGRAGRLPQISVARRGRPPRPGRRTLVL